MSPKTAAGPLACLLMAVAMAWGCERPSRGPVPELQRVLAGPPPADSPSLFPAETWEATRRFYDHRKLRLAWTAPGASADAALGVLQAAALHGLDPATYGPRSLDLERQQLESPEAGEGQRDARSVAFDARLTNALISLGRDVAVGRRPPRLLDQQWRAARRLPDLASTLAQAAEAGELSGWLDTIRPPHEGYRALQAALARLRAGAGTGPWPDVPAVTVARGGRDPAVRVLRQRLKTAGDLTTPAGPDPDLFDETVEQAVRHFQARHGLEPTGRVDAATRAELNVPRAARVGQLAMNMERWRWLPDTLGDRYVWVNIPAFELNLVERGRRALEMRAIVGKQGHETPIFSDLMTVVVFSPYWSVPDVAADQMLPTLAEDPAYLADNNVELVRIAGQQAEPVDPATLDWADDVTRETIRFRQRPGARNALGLVKFLFPGEHHVYIHDTPADALFARRTRTLSHGCVRAEDPVALARHVLRDLDRWTDETIREAMHAGIETHVPLSRPLPVHLTYFTAWVDESGTLQFRPDVYGHDERQRRARLSAVGPALSARR